MSRVDAPTVVDAGSTAGLDIAGLDIAGLGIAGLATALDAAAMSTRLEVDVSSLRLLGLKPGRRAVVRYETSSGPLIGKLRAGHRPTSPFRLMERFRAAGFDRGPVRVAEPVAVFSDLEMWVQRAAPGRPGNELLADPVVAADVARLAAGALHAVHRCAVPTRRVHSIDDELAVLDRRLAATAELRPDLHHRLRALAALCHRRSVDARRLDRRGGPTGIHRDAYADQFVVDGLEPRRADDVVTTIIDFDLHCLGDPAVDVGNFVAHLTEHALRSVGDPAALADAEAACRDTYLALAGPEHGAAIDAYVDLSLARHVALSTTVAGRDHLTDAVLELCEARLR